MRQVNTQLQADRRAEILDAAERCFIRSGFHQASMQEICAEAKMSPGNLYRYFPSKEAITDDPSLRTSTLLQSVMTFLRIVIPPYVHVAT